MNALLESNKKPGPSPLPTCGTCKWAVQHLKAFRCHYNPPCLRLPYDNLSAFPPIELRSAGCSKHERKEA